MTPTPTPEVVVPREPTDEMLRASLATDLPATYRTHLRHPFNGEKTALEVEKAITKERKRWAAILAASPQPVVAPSDLSGEDDLVILPPISLDGPHRPNRHRQWLSRQLLDSKLTDEEAYGIVACHPSISDTADAINAAKSGKASA